MNSEHDDKPDDEDLGIPLDELPDLEGLPASPGENQPSEEWSPVMPDADPPAVVQGEEPLEDAAGLYADDHLPLRSEAPPDTEAGDRFPSGLDPLAPMESEAVEEAVPEAGTDGGDDQEADLPSRLLQIQAQLAALQREFEGKIKYDAHKDAIIDRLHDELQEYRQDFLKKHILTVILDVIKIADDIRKWLHYFRALEPAQRDPLKLFRYLEAIPTDLEDVFYWHGVKPFSSSGGAFDPTRQRAVKKIATDEPDKDKTVARSLRPGYVWDDKVIRQEMVAVYLHEEGSQMETTRNDND